MHNIYIYIYIYLPFGAGIIFLILAHLYIKCEQYRKNTLELWNKLHFEEKKGEYIPYLKNSVPIFVK